MRLFREIVNALLMAFGASILIVLCGDLLADGKIMLSARAAPEPAGFPAVFILAGWGLLSVLCVILNWNRQPW